MPPLPGGWQQWWPFALLVVAAFAAGWVTLRSYLLPEFNTLLALLSLPFVLYVRDRRRRPWRFALLAVFLLVLFPLLQIKITFHLAWCFVLLFLTESAVGRLNSMPVALLFVLSPLPHYFASVLGFPLRIWLSNAAGSIFRAMGMQVEVQGNLFVQNGTEFAVDPACTGIHMFVTGLVVFVILLSYQEKRTGRVLPIWGQGLLLLLGMGLVLLANLFRIVGLVLLRSAPESFSHDAVGMACLIFYFVLPMFFGMRFAVRKWGRRQSEEEGERRVELRTSDRKRMAMGVLLVAGLLVAGPMGKKPDQHLQNLQLTHLEAPGYATCLTEDGVLALEAEGSLVYLKPPVPFYGADHYPEICWRASGYRVRAPQVQTVAGTEMMVARLENEDHSMVTAWWYDNGERQTLSTFDWRWGQLRGELGFYLVNVTVGERSELEAAVEEWQGCRVVPEITIFR